MEEFARNLQLSEEIKVAPKTWQWMHSLYTTIHVIVSEEQNTIVRMHNEFLLDRMRKCLDLLSMFRYQSIKCIFARITMKMKNNLGNELAYPNFPGAKCQSLGLDNDKLLDHLENVSLLHKIDKTQITNGLIMELNKLQTKEKRTRKDLMNWIKTLFGNQNISEYNLSRSINEICEKYKRYSKGQGRHPEILNKFIVEKFEVTEYNRTKHSKEITDKSEKNLSQSHNPKLNQLKTTFNKREIQIKELKRVCEAISLQTNSKKRYRLMLETEVRKASNHLKFRNQQFTRFEDARIVRTVQNLKKKIKRRDRKIEKNKCELSEMYSLTDLYKSIIQDFQAKEKKQKKQLEMALEENLKCKNQRTQIYDKKQEEEEEIKIKREIDLLINRIRDYEVEVDTMEEELNEDKNLNLFENGKFSDKIRETYRNLLSIGVSCNNINDIVTCILNKLFGIQVDKLPSDTTNRNIAREGLLLAQQQIYDELSTANNITLCSDETTKFSLQYGTYEVHKEDGRVLTLGLRDLASGSAETSLNTLINCMDDVARIAGGGRETVEKMIANIKNTMSDRHVVQKKLNSLLFKYRSSILPQIIEGWDEMTSVEKDQVTKMNNFFCGLHFVVALGKQANACLQMWEKLSNNTSSESPNKATDNKSNQGIDSGTVTLIRNVSKCIHPRDGDKELGKMNAFKVFMTERGETKLPIAPFQGHRFNIVFHNAAGVYFLTDIGLLDEFFNIYGNENDLTKAINTDIKVLHYRAGARALGLIGKIITVPLWNVLEKVNNITDMNTNYTKLLECLEEWKKDASSFLKGKLRVFSDVPVHEDAVYASLIRQNEQLDTLTQQILELIFASFTLLIRRLLADHLPGGEYGLLHRDDVASVPAANVGVERSFGMLDRLLREKPNASSCLLEGLIMYKKNKTSDWVGELDEEKKKKVMEIARRGVRQQIRLFKERNIKIKKMRASLQEEKVKEKNKQKRKRFIRHSPKKDVLKRNVHKNLEISSNKDTLPSEDIRFSESNVNDSFSQELNDVLSHRDCILIDAEDSFKDPLIVNSVDCVINPDEILGKRIEHLWVEEGECKWYKGVVVGHDRPEEDLWYIKYDHEDSLYEITDIEKYIFCKELLVVEPGIDDLLGRKISVLSVGDDDEQLWSEVRVFDAVYDENFDEPLFLVRNETVNDDDDVDDYDSIEAVIPLLENYRKHEIRLM